MGSQAESLGQVRDWWDFNSRARWDSVVRLWAKLRDWLDYVFRDWWDFVARAWLGVGCFSLALVSEPGCSFTGPFLPTPLCF